jgi:hypothetical protein
VVRCYESVSDSVIEEMGEDLTVGKRIVALEGNARSRSRADWRPQTGIR